MKYDIRISRTMWQTVIVQVEADTVKDAKQIAEERYLMDEPSFPDIDAMVLDVEFECDGETFNLDELDDVKV